MRHLLHIFLIFITFQTIGQTYTIKDNTDEGTLPFVRIQFTDGSTTFTDIDGYFTWTENNPFIRVKYAGYYDTTIYQDKVKDFSIVLRPLAQEFEDVVILPGVNPAERIIKAVIDHRKDNHPLKKNAFEYNTYNKFVLDVDSTTYQQVKNKEVSDSLTEDEKFIKRQHFFLLESATHRRFIPPAKDREDVLAYRISGLNNPIFSTIAQSLQNFHFYEDEFTLLMTTYYSPIASDAIKRYYFIIQDTTYSGKDTTFTISFQPRIGKEHQALKGMLFINTNGYAIERVIAEPHKKGDISLKVVQEYQFIQGKKWFPVSLSTHIELGGALSISDQGKLVGKGNSYIRDIIIDPDDMKKRGFNNVAISTKEEAGRVNEQDWINYRKAELTEREHNTYTTLDSLNKELNLDKKVNTLGILVSGKIPIWKFSLPIERLLDYNIQEGYRLGLGLETNRHFSERLTLGGYFAWGTKDKEWKYGGFASYDFYKPLGIKLTARFQDDRLQRGATILKQTTWDLLQPQFISNFYRRDLEKQRLAELQFTIAPLGNLTLHLIGNYQRIEFKDNYSYYFRDNWTSGLDAFETALEVKWNIRQRILILGDYRLAQATKFPKISARLSKFIPEVFDSTTDFMRAYVNIVEELQSKRLGNLTLSLTLTQTFGTAPLTFLNVVPGTMEKLGIITMSAMETIYPSEFYAERQAMFLMRYDFPTIRTKVKIFQPQFGLHHGIAIGDLKNRDIHQLAAHFPLQSLDKGVYEAGVILNGIINMSGLKLGIGGFYRYGHYSNDTWYKNIMPKLALKFGF